MILLMPLCLLAQVPTPNIICGVIIWLTALHFQADNWGSYFTEHPRADESKL